MTINSNCLPTLVSSWGEELEMDEKLHENSTLEPCLGIILIM